MTDYREILENMGYKLSDRGNFWHTSAIFRGGDNLNAIQIYKDSGVWKDYVEDSNFLPFEALVERTLGTKDASVIKSVLHGSKNNEIRPPKKQLLSEEKSYPASCLQKLLPHYDFFSNAPRNISLWTLEDYKCGLATSGKMYQRLVFPIFRQDGRIHGFSGRKVVERSDNDERPKWLHNGKSSEWFYPFHTTRETAKSILKNKRVFIVESVGDSVSLYDKGVCENLVSFGLALSPKFISRLQNLPVDKIVLAFNNDFEKEKNRGLIGAVKAILKLAEVVDITRLYLCLPQKNDFGCMSKEDVDLYLKHFNTLDHKTSCEKVIEEAKKIEKQLERPNKAFSDSLKKFIKKYSFHYAD